MIRLMCLLLVAGTLVWSQRKESQFDSSRELSLTAGPVIQEDLGVALLPGKILATSEASIAQSVFFNLRKPKIPQRPCEVDCAPNVKWLADNLPAISSSCWIPKMKVLSATVLATVQRETLEACFAECLLQPICSVLTYDAFNGECTLQNKNYYHPESRVDSSNSATSTVDCLLDKMSISRHTACGGSSNPLFDVLVSELVDSRARIENAHVRRFEDLKSAFDIAWDTASSTTEPHGNRRQKRLGWSDFDFLEEIPVVNWFYQLLKSPSDNKKVRQHIQLFQRAFEQFAQDSIKIMGNLKKFDQEILKIMDGELEEVYSTINALKCDILSVASVLTHVQTDKRYEQRLETLFYGARHGRLVTPVATTLTLQDLKMVVSGNPAFQGTLYQGRPELLFRVADLMLVGVTNGERGMLLHYVLVAPKLLEGSLFRTYVPKTVPITLSETETQCFIVQAPELVIIEQGTVKTVKVTDCLEKDEVIYCTERMEDRFSPFKAPWQCFGENPASSGCKLSPVPCTTKMLFTKGGALVFSQDEVTAMPVDESVHLSIVSKAGKTTYFLGWDKYKHVQASRMVMYSPTANETATVLTWKSPQAKTNLRNWLKDSQIVRNRENITRLASLVNETAEMAMADYQVGYLGLNTSKRSFFETLAWISLGITVLTTILYAVVQCLKGRYGSSHVTNLTQALSHFMNRGEIPNQNPANPDRNQEAGLTYTTNATEQEPSYVQMNTLRRVQNYRPLPTVVEEEAPTSHCQITELQVTEEHSASLSPKPGAPTDSARDRREKGQGTARLPLGFVLKMRNSNKNSTRAPMNEAQTQTTLYPELE